jgi:hypothetical protein
MVAALDGGAPDPDVKPEVSVSIAMDRPHAPSPVFAAPIARRDLEPGGRLLPALAIAPPVQPRGDRGAETQLPSTGRSRRHAPALAGEPSRELPRAPAVPVASPDPATIVQALAAHAGAPATGALLRSGPRVPGPPALLVQSQRPADLSRSGGISAAAPPPVHVTIGRVEVRANASGAERPPARRAAGPKLTLEDYLHGRRGSR